jgi:hypothetical protein
MKTETEIERARESIKEYRKGYGQSQLPTDCIIQLMMGHAKREQLRIGGVSQQRELLNALADDFNEGTDTYVGQARIESVLKAFNCG